MWGRFRDCLHLTAMENMNTAVPGCFNLRRQTVNNIRLCGAGYSCLDYRVNRELMPIQTVTNFFPNLITRRIVIHTSRWAADNDSTFTGVPSITRRKRAIWYLARSFHTILHCIKSSVMGYDGNNCSLLTSMHITTKRERAHNSAKRKHHQESHCAAGIPITGFPVTHHNHQKLGSLINPPLNQCFQKFVCPIYPPSNELVLPSVTRG